MTFLYDQGIRASSDVWGAYLEVTDLFKGVTCSECGNVLYCARQYWGYWRQECGVCGHVLFSEGFFIEACYGGADAY